jgi:acetyltransferase-like isoleucine patch superfamily enzyme
MVILAPRARVSKLADLEASVRGTRIVVGANSVIDDFVKAKPVGGKKDVIIGDHTYINSGVVIYSGNGVQIGNNVLISANCTLAPVSHEFRSRERSIREQGFQPSRGGIVIEDDVWIGANTVLLDGAILRRGSVVGANSLVLGELAPYSINVGSPSRQTGMRS